MKQNPFDIYTAEYEQWFSENSNLFQSELLALKKVVPAGKKGLEVGVGSGIFAEKLGVKYGIDPSEKMLYVARTRGINTVTGVAEELPYGNESFDFALYITSICFIEDPDLALKEAYRVIVPNGDLIIAIIDKNSALGIRLNERKKESKFYEPATFFSSEEIVSLMESNGFEVTETYQTLIENNSNIVEQPQEGYGKGGFVVIKGKKR